MLHDDGRHSRTRQQHNNERDKQRIVVPRYDPITLFFLPGCPFRKSSFNYFDSHYALFPYSGNSKLELDAIHCVHLPPPPPQVWEQTMAKSFTFRIKNCCLRHRGRWDGGSIDCRPPNRMCEYSLTSPVAALANGEIEIVSTGANVNFGKRY